MSFRRATSLSMESDMRVQIHHTHLVRHRWRSCRGDLSDQCGAPCPQMVRLLNQSQGRDRGGGMKPHMLLLAPLLLLVPALILHRLHMLHWEHASSHHFAISLDLDGEEADVAGVHPPSPLPWSIYTLRQRIGFRTRPGKPSGETGMRRVCGRVGPG